MDGGTVQFLQSQTNYIFWEQSCWCSCKHFSNGTRCDTLRDQGIEGVWYLKELVDSKKSVNSQFLFKHEPWLLQPLEQTLFILQSLLFSLLFFSRVVILVILVITWFKMTMSRNLCSRDRSSRNLTNKPTAQMMAARRLEGSKRLIDTIRLKYFLLMNSLH